MAAVVSGQWSQVTGVKNRHARSRILTMTLLPVVSVQIVLPEMCSFCAAKGHTITCRRPSGLMSKGATQMTALNTLVRL